MNKAPVISIDGPSGTGKGTVSLRLARQLGWHLLDSGALYRILAYAAQQQDIALEHYAEIADLSARLTVDFHLQAEQELVRVLLAGEDISPSIRTEECGSAASRIATSSEIRQAILQWQRDFQQTPGLIADGRDMGTVVFPTAELKIYLTASAQERARRRYKQLNAKGIGVTLQRLSADIAERDSRDMQRAVSPLRPADDAIIIDTTDSSLEEIFQLVWGLYKEKFT